MVFNEAVVGISKTLTPKPTDSAAHDLQGRRLDAPAAKGIYVKDGQKVIVK